MGLIWLRDDAIGQLLIVKLVRNLVKEIGSALALLVALVLADYPDHTCPLHDAAVVAHSLY
jgi:hypothetical protein